MAVDFDVVLRAVDFLEVDFDADDLAALLAVLLPAVVLAEAFLADALFVELCLPSGTRVSAPFEGELATPSDGLHRLVGDGVALFAEGLDGVAAGETGVGREIGKVGDGGILRNLAHRYPPRARAGRRHPSRGAFHAPRK